MHKWIFQLIYLTTNMKLPYCRSEGLSSHWAVRPGTSTTSTIAVSGVLVCLRASVLARRGRDWSWSTRILLVLRNGDIGSVRSSDFNNLRSLRSILPNTVSTRRWSVGSCGLVRATWSWTLALALSLLVSLLLNPLLGVVLLNSILPFSFLLLNPCFFLELSLSTLSIFSVLLALAKALRSSFLLNPGLLFELLPGFNSIDLCLLFGFFFILELLSSKLSLSFDQFLDSLNLFFLGLLALFSLGLGISDSLDFLQNQSVVLLIFFELFLS